jgi:hypothetical protein
MVRKACATTPFKLSDVTFVTNPTVFVNAFLDSNKSETSFGVSQKPAAMQKNAGK